MAYATPEEYEAYTGATVPAGIALMLTRASRVVDQVLLSAVYDVDDDGLPTDPAVQAALRDATIEQAAYWAQTGEDGTGALSEYANVSIGSVSLGRAQTEGAGPGSGARTLAPQAWQILTQAGLTGHAPRAC